MKQDVTKGMFRDAFKACGRGDQFSYEGLGHLYDWLEDGHDGEQEYNLDVIALCCEFAEGSVYEVLDQYNLESIDELEEKTIVVWHDQPNAIVLYVQF